MRGRRAAALVAMAAATVAAAAFTVARDGDGIVAWTREAQHGRLGPEPVRALEPPGPAVPSRRRVLLGRSVRGRPIAAYELGDPRARRKVVVVGCIHGDEPAGVAVIRQLARGSPPRAVDLWLIPSINPDGQAAGTRQNAHRVDLNRNFPWRWRPLGPPGTQQYAGPRALSEPESRIAHTLIVRLRPAITIWFHQPLGLVDESGGSLAVERRFARLAALPLRRLARYPGSAASWQDNRFRGSTAFVVELPPGRPSRSEVDRWSDAVRRSSAVG